MIAAAVAAGALVLSLTPAQAVARRPVLPPMAVARGLDNPRGLAFGPDGALYVAESGRGGAGPCHDSAEGGPACFGRSGAVTVIRNGHQRRLVTRLPSLAGTGGTRASGPSDVAVDAHGTVSFLIGLGASPDLRHQIPQLAGMAKLYTAGSPAPKTAGRPFPDAGGDSVPAVVAPAAPSAAGSFRARAVADLGAYEKRVNPDGVAPPDSNPNGLAVTSRARYVVDAGGNSLLKVSARGRVSTVAVFPRRTVLAPEGTPGVPAGTPIPMQAVPTSAVRGPDGAWYVGELTGFPFPAGQARVYRVVPGHPPTVYATGLTTVIDLAFGPRGRLYALELAHHGLLSGDETGALIEVDPHGRHRIIASAGLRAPGGVAIRGRYAYLTTCSTCAGTGTVVKARL